MEFSFRGLALFSCWIDSGKNKSRWGLRPISDNLSRYTFFLRLDGHCESSPLGIEECVDVEWPRPWGVSSTEQIDRVASYLRQVELDKSLEY